MSKPEKYYRTHTDALSDRKKGDRIYYDPYKPGYYLTTPKKVDFWGFDKEPPTHFYRYGILWFTTKEEAQENNENNDEICYDKGMKLYYIKKPKKSIWKF